MYFSWINKNSIKAWKKHTKMTLNLVVPLGKVKFVFHNPKQPDVFREETIGEDNYKRLTVPLVFGLASMEFLMNLAWWQMFQIFYMMKMKF